MDPNPVKTAVLWRQLPIEIHRAVSSPSREGSMMMVAQPASNVAGDKFRYYII